MLTYTFCSWRKQESHTPFSCLNYKKIVENCSLKKKRRNKSKYIKWMSINSKSLFSKLIFQKQNHESASAHKNAFGGNPCTWESQRSNAMISGHLRSVDCLPRILLLRQKPFFLTFARNPNSFISVVAVYLSHPWFYQIWIPCNLLQN